MNILMHSIVSLKFLIQAAHVISFHNNTFLFHNICKATNRVTDFAKLTAQNCVLVKRLWQKKYANVIVNLNNVKYIKEFKKLVWKAS